MDAVPVWDTRDSGFRLRFEGLLESLSLEEGLVAAGRRAGEPPELLVRRIIEDVRRRGDAALIEYTERFDRCRLTADQLRVSASEIQDAAQRCPPEYLRALRLAAERIRKFQRAILLHDPEPLDEDGRKVAIRYRPMDAVGIYIPGGTASLASSLLMAAIPATVAGVPRVALATPPRADGTVSDDRLAAAAVAGVDEVYRIGGAQAIAALAYGTESVQAVDFIAGPGNIYTTLAKRQVYGQVGIEMLPGPSEVVIIADSSVQPELVAADLLAQAEHNPGSAVLLTPDEGVAQAVQAAVEAQLGDLSRAEAARECLARYGALIVTRSLEECVELANELAPEHLQVMTRDPQGVAAQVRHAAAVFLGSFTPVAVGDYIAGPSHILPTARTARFSSGLTANDFLKRTSIISYDRAALTRDAAEVQRLALAEGLDGHARSVGLRVTPRDQPRR